MIEKLPVLWLILIIIFIMGLSFFLTFNRDTLSNDVSIFGVFSIMGFIIYGLYYLIKNYKNK